MSFIAFIVALMGVAIIGTLADMAGHALRRAWRRHLELRSIARTGRLCRLYGFCSPAEDERDWLARFRKEIAR